MRLDKGGPHAFRVQADAGQTLFLNTNGDARLQVYTSDQHPLTGIIAQPGPVEVGLPQSGNYFIAVRGNGKVILSVYLPSLPAGTHGGATPAVSQLTPVPLPADSQPLAFQPGSTTITITIKLQRGVPQGFQLTAKAGQMLSMTADGDVTVAMLTPENTALAPASAIPGQWQFKFPADGNYTLVLLGLNYVDLTFSQTNPSG
jgi:hypothetical protein